MGILLILWSMKETIIFFYTPQDLLTSKKDIQGKLVRLGGIVKLGSLKRNNIHTIEFIITDGSRDIITSYSGPLPPLFKEGQGVVALGTYRKEKGFYAKEILAKHDENYRPPEILNILEQKNKKE